MKNHIKMIVVLRLMAPLIIAARWVARHAAPTGIGVLHLLIVIVAVIETPPADPDSGHLWKTVRAGKVRSDEQFEQVFVSGAPFRPASWPSCISRDASQTLPEGGES
ncbi:MAG: hypothetical protein ACXWE2_05020 [Methylobacter sp.]